MIQYEYLEKGILSFPELQELGKQGWNLCATKSDWNLFSRPLQPDGTMFVSMVVYGDNVDYDIVKVTDLTFQSRNEYNSFVQKCKEAIKFLEYYSRHDSYSDWDDILIDDELEESLGLIFTDAEKEEFETKATEYIEFMTPFVGTEADDKKPMVIRKIKYYEYSASELFQIQK